MSRWQAVVFDLDDTLYPEKEYIFSGFYAVSNYAKVEYNLTTDISFNTLCNLFNNNIRNNTFNI